MKRCKGCGAEISQRLKPGPGRPPTYCDPKENPECAAARAAGRQCLKRARAFNALTRVILGLPELPKRVMDHRNEDELGYEAGPVTSRWDDMSAGELWLRGRRNDAEDLAQKQQRQVAGRLGAVKDRADDVLLERVHRGSVRALRALGADQEILEAVEASWERQDRARVA